MESPLTDAQALVYDGIMQSVRKPGSLCVLEGYAGTGKTFLISQLIAKLAESKPVGVSAPTNKAVKVLAEKIRNTRLLPLNGDASKSARLRSSACVHYGSIHSFLGLRLKERENGTQEIEPEGTPCISDFSVLIVDEASMISKSLFQQILLSRGNTSVVFVGDPFQLPPVDIDHKQSVSPVFERVQQKFVLSEIIRQAEDNPIIELSMRIREKAQINEKVSPAYLAEVLPPPPSKAVLKHSTKQNMLAYVVEAAKKGMDARIITYTNESVVAFNHAIHQSIYGETEFPYSVGERVILQEQGYGKGINDKAVQMFNSEEVIVESVCAQQHPKFPDIPALKITVQREDGELASGYTPEYETIFRAYMNQQWAEWRKMKSDASQEKNPVIKARLMAEAKNKSNNNYAIKNAFLPLRHGYAMTAHKSQGSTFDMAIIDFDNIARFMQDAFNFSRALYVAVTRASKLTVIICGA